MFSAVPFVQGASWSLEKSCELQKKISLSENRVDTFYPSYILYKNILKVERAGIFKQMDEGCNDGFWFQQASARK